MPSKRYLRSLQESVAILFAFRIIVTVLVATAALSGTVDNAFAQPVETAPLQLEAKIPLGSVHGRIDHMAVDLKRQRLFVAELGNDSVGIMDLANRKLIHTIPGLREPQGVGYEPSTDMLYVANAGDGSVRLFDGNDYAARGRIELGSDADNIRVDAAASRIFVGYGSGALAVIDMPSGIPQRLRELLDRLAQMAQAPSIVPSIDEISAPRRREPFASVTRD